MKPIDLLYFMLQQTKDIAIAYRIYPGVSKTPIVFSDDKLKLTEVGVSTLKKSLGQLRSKIFFLLDNCPLAYEAMIKKYFTEHEAIFIHYEGIGNLATFGKQIDLLLLQTDSEIIMFAEDDYIYKPRELEKAVDLFSANEEIDFVTPYDHSDSYSLPIHTRHQYEIIIHAGLHWRSSASTCLTFLTTKKTLKRTESIFRSYCHNNWDSSLWFALTKYNVATLKSIFLFINDTFLFKTVIKSWLYGWRQILFGKRYKLWQPMPSIATHMEKTGLAPNVDWGKMITSEQI
jgi:hypothetical protein